MPIKLKSSATIMDETFCDSKDIPKEYIKEKPFMVFRQGQWVNVCFHNKKTNKHFKPKKIKG